MRPVNYVLVATLTAALSGTAAAQTQPPAPPTSTQQPAVVVAVPEPTPEYHWMTAGFIGSSLATNTDLFNNVGVETGSPDGGLTYGFQIGYVWGAVGAEFLADFGGSLDFTANERFFNNTEFNSSPSVRSYMANLIGVIPVGEERMFQPYISGGVGTIHLNADVIDRSRFADDFDITDDDLINTSQGEFGGNLGLGAMAFADRFGVRTDIRYYKAWGSQDNIDNATTVGDALAQAFLSDLSFWRWNVGLAVRW